VLIVAPWTIAIMQATEGAFLAEAVGKDLLPKLISGQESHGAPPGYHVVLLMLGFFPASLQVAPALRDAWRTRLLPAERFCLAWLVPAWIVFELIPTKLPHYVLPLYPALALLTARFAAARSRRRGRPSGCGRCSGCGSWSRSRSRARRSPSCRWSTGRSTGSRSCRCSPAPPARSPPWSRRGAARRCAR